MRLEEARRPRLEADKQARMRRFAEFETAMAKVTGPEASNRSGRHRGRSSCYRAV